jgi:endoglucanase
VDLNAHLKALSAIAAPSGHEGPARDAIRAAWADLVDEFQTDGLGSLIALKRGTGADPRRRVMLCAHMDEIGLMVAGIRHGFIRASALGGIDFRVLPGQPVIVHGQRALKGVFGAAPPHMALDRKQYPKREELWIDVGLPAAEVETLARIGDLITFDAPPVELKGERLAAKSLDNRVSVAAVTVCLDALARRAHLWDVVAVASAQEEVSGSSGARTAAYRIEPDIAIVIDGSYGRQRGVDDDESFALGDGPTIGRGPNFHPLLEKALEKAAKVEEIKTQVEVIPGNSLTDAWEVQITGTGVPTALIGIPMRNMHTPVETIDLRDVRRAGRLMAAFVAGLEPDFLAEIAWPETIP